MVERVALVLRGRIMTDLSQMLPVRHAKWHSQFYAYVIAVLKRGALLGIDRSLRR
jgi:hypothetical protein